MSPNNGSCFASSAVTLPAKGDNVANRPNQKLRLLFLLKTLMEKTDKLAALKEKYQELTGKRKSLDLFAISHDNQNAQIQIVDAKGQSFESSNPKCIKEVIDIWMKDFAKAIEETEKEIRNLYAC